MKMVVLTREYECVNITLDSFFNDNPDLDRAAIEAALEQGGIYRDGGGAVPEWSLTPLQFGVFHADPLGRPDSEPEAVFDNEKEAGEYADLLNAEEEAYNAGTDDLPSWRSHDYFVSEID